MLPHGLVGREVLALHEQVGLSHGRRAGRGVLGGPRLAGPAGRSAAGDPADLVVYDDDPRADLRVAPRRVLRRVAPSILARPRVVA